MTAAEHEAAIAQLLAELGDTADAVADTLRAKGIKGRRDNTLCCPVANYLKDAGRPYARVGQLDVCVVDLDEGYHWVGLPDAAVWFIHRFDSGVYLDLVEVDG